MSIKIDKGKCKACGNCVRVCPGNLLRQDKDGKAYIRYPKDCWGCAACLKECPAAAIQYYLGADIGGQGGYLFTKNHSDCIDWYIISPDGTERHIKINKKESNQY